MEKLDDEKPPVSPKEVKDDSTADVPAENIEEGKEEEAVTDTDSESDSDSSSDSDSDSEYECEVCQKTFSGYLPFKKHRKGKKHAKAVIKMKKEKKLLKMEENDKSPEENLVGEHYAECTTCTKDFYGPEAYEQHLKCKKHKQRTLEASKEGGKTDKEKLRKLSKKKRVAVSVLEDGKEIKTLSLDDEDEKRESECEDCEKFISGFIPYMQHVTSKAHGKMLEKKAQLHKVVSETHKEDPTTSKEEISTLRIEDDVLVCKACSTSFSRPKHAMTHMKSEKHAQQLEKYLWKLEKKKQKKYSKQDDLENSKKKREQVENEDEYNTVKWKLGSSRGTRHGTVNLERTDVKHATSSNQKDNLALPITTNYGNLFLF